MQKQNIEVSTLELFFFGMSEASVLELFLVKDEYEQVFGNKQRWSELVKCAKEKWHQESSNPAAFKKQLDQLNIEYEQVFGRSLYEHFPRLSNDLWVANATRQDLMTEIYELCMERTSIAKKIRNAKYLLPITKDALLAAL